MAGLRISTSVSSTRSLRQLGQLLRSSLVSPSPLPLVDVGLGHLPAQPGLGDAQILGDLRDRVLPRPGQLHGSTTELRRASVPAYGLLSGDHRRLRTGVRGPGPLQTWVVSRWRSGWRWVGSRWRSGWRWVGSRW